MPAVQRVFPAAESSVSADSSTPVKKKNSLDFQGFLKIIAAQMKNQSLSSSPTDTSQYVMEMTLFSVIESMRTMTQQSTRQYASSLVGKDVTLSKLNSATGQKEEVTGTVEAVDFDPATDKTSLAINGKAYDADDLVDIYGDHISLGKDLAAIGEQSTREYATSLIGKNVDLSVPNSKTGKKDSVSGKVDKVIFDPSTGAISLQINGKSYSVSDIDDISN